MSAHLKIVVVLTASVILAWSAANLTAQDSAEAPATTPEVAVEAGQSATSAEDAIREAFNFIPEVVAKSESFTITGDDVQRAIARRLSQSQMPPAGLGQVPEQILRNLAYNATQKLVDQRLIEAKAREEGYVPATDMATEQLAQWEEKAGKEKMEQSLEENEVTREELLADLGRELGVRKWIQEEVMSNGNVTDEIAKAFYDENPQAFTTNAQTSASHILISAGPSASEAEHKKARKKAEELRSKLEEGADFAEMAQSESDCPSSKKGGDLGFFGRKQMALAFEKAAFALEDGELSDVVKTQYGYHVIKGGPSKEASAVPFEQVKPRLMQNLHRQMAQEAMQSVVQVLRDQTEVEMMIEKPEAPQALPAQPPAPPAAPEGEATEAE